MYLNGVRFTAPQARVLGGLKSGATLRVNNATGVYELRHGKILQEVHPSVVDALLNKGFIVERDVGRYGLRQRDLAKADTRAGFQ